MSADPRHITIAVRPNPDEDDCLSASAGLRGSLLLDLDLRLGLRDAHVSGCESVVGRAHPSPRSTAATPAASLVFVPEGDTVRIEYGRVSRELFRAWMELAGAEERAENEKLVDTV